MKWLFGFGLVVLFVFTALSPASAQGFDSPGLRVSPLRTELTIGPGTTLKSNLNVTNLTDKNMIVQLSSELFSVINPEYNYSFTVDTDVTRWVQFETTSVALEPGQSQRVSYDIAVPIGAEPGGQYISIFASTDSEQDAGAITSRQRIASLLYITVDGDVTRDGSLLSLSHPWWISGKTDWSVNLKNQGTAHFRSRYLVQIFALVGANPLAQMNGEALVLPGTIRRVTDTFPVPQYPGIYTVIYAIGLGDQPAQTETRYILYVPGWMWLVIGLAAVLSIMLIIRRRRPAV